MILQERIKELEKELEALKNANETLATNLTNEVTKLQEENKYLIEQAEEVANDYEDIGKQLSKTCDELELYKKALDIASDELKWNCNTIQFCKRKNKWCNGFDKKCWFDYLLKIAKERLENVKQD